MVDTGLIMDASIVAAFSHAAKSTFKDMFGLEAANRTRASSGPPMITAGTSLVSSASRARRTASSR